MDIAERSKERSSLILAILTLVTVGLSLIISTGQVLIQQEEAGMQHLNLTARSVLQAVDSSLRRSLAMQGNDVSSFVRSAKEYFRELEQSGDVLFVGLIDKDGGRILSSRDHRESKAVMFPPDALKELRVSGEWHGRVGYGLQSAYVYSKLIQSTTEYEMILSYSSPAYLVVGLDMAKHLAIYRQFRQNALFQAAYILGAVIFIWALIMALFKRRKMAGKAVMLERFQARLLDNLPDGLVTINTHGVVLAVNPAADALLQGLSAQSYSDSASSHDGVSDATEQEAASTVFTGLTGIAGIGTKEHKKSKESKTVQYKKLTSNNIIGKELQELPEDVFRCLTVPAADSKGWRQEAVSGAHLEILSVPIPSVEDDDSALRLVIIRDRTQIKTLERNLSEAEKLAAVGTLAAGVAHEIRNPLSSLRGFAQYFAKKFRDKAPEEMYAQTMVREADRLNRVIADLLFLSRPRAIEPHWIMLERVIHDIEALIQFELEEQKMNFSVRLDAPTLWADEDALKQALLNLALNSLDALRESKSEEKQIAISTETDANGVWVVVSDTGMGMSKEQQEQAFEPFFTTKKKGTGLGLALVHKTVREHGGKAVIDSGTGQGTAIRLFFPNGEGESGAN